MQKRSSPAGTSSGGGVGIAMSPLTSSASAPSSTSSTAFTTSSLRACCFALTTAPWTVLLARAWIWFRPRARYLVPAVLLVLLLVHLSSDYFSTYSPFRNNDQRTLLSSPLPSSPLSRRPGGPAVVRNDDIDISNDDNSDDNDAAADNSDDLPLAEFTAFDPQANIAIAIPVGGRTERSAQLRQIIERLVSGGALASHIYVFEDVNSRPGGAPFDSIRTVCAELNVPLVYDYIPLENEDHTNFGLHLARHYNFFLNFLFVDEESIPVDQRPRFDAHPPTLRRRAFDFVVVIEDDLEVSPDFVKYFFSMSRVMRADPTLYCVSAHQDNAFLGIHRDDDFDGAASPARLDALEPFQFDFRRGNHFMAPGWMTSRDMYTHVVRPKWLDAHGNYEFKNELHLRNGHWDRFFDSLTGERDCIFPELPRITHQGADGFTVNKRSQMELYSNLRLAHLPTSVSYGDLRRLTQTGYMQTTRAFIRSAVVLLTLDEARMYRNERLVFVVPALNDKDDKWNDVLNKYFGLIGVGGYGGWEGYVKVRGIFRGAVFVRWLTNVVLLVGQYSPYMQYVLDRATQHPLLGIADDVPMRVSHLGCFVDSARRDLPVYIDHFSPGTMTPAACLATCNHRGYRYAGIQVGDECYCGNTYGGQGAAELSECSAQCRGYDTLAVQFADPQRAAGAVGSVHVDSEEGEHEEESADSNGGRRSRRLSKERKKKTKSIKSTTTKRGNEADAVDRSLPCGGGFRNSVYENAHPKTRRYFEEARVAPEGVQFVVADAGQSCTAACASTGGAGFPRCDERMFPLIHRSCAILREIFNDGGASCAVCREEDDPERGFATPARLDGTDTCLFSRARYHRCDWEPPAGLTRVCTCVAAAVA